MRLSRTRHCSGLMRFAHRTPWRPQRQRIGYSDTHCGSCTASAVRSESRTVCGRACLCLDDPEPSPWRLHTASGSALHFCMWCLCDSGPLFGVMAFAAPVSLLPSVIPPHLRSLPSTDITPLLRYTEPLSPPTRPCVRFRARTTLPGLPLLLLSPSSTHAVATTPTEPSFLLPLTSRPVPAFPV